MSSLNIPSTPFPPTFSSPTTSLTPLTGIRLKTSAASLGDGLPGHLAGPIPNTHTEDAEEKGRRVVLGLPELSNVYSTHHGDSSCATEPQDAAIEAANQGRQRQDSREGMPSPSGQALGQWHGKGNHVPPLWSHYQRQERDHWDQLGDPTATDDRREDASLQPDTVGWTHRTGPGARRDRRSREIAGRSPFGSTNSLEQSDRSSMPSGRGDGRNGQDHKPDGSEPGVSQTMKTGQKKRLLGGIKKTKRCGKDGVRPSRRRRDNRATKTSQYSASTSARLPRQKCVQFCSVLLLT